MKRFILFLTVALFAFASFAQQTTMMYKTPDGVNPAKFRQATFDLEYGLYGYNALSPYKLALKIGDTYLTGRDAYNELKEPVWGDTGDQVFKNTLPILTPSVSPDLTFQLYPWFSVDDTLPTEDAVSPYGYEARKQYGTGYWVVQNLTKDDLLIVIQMFQLIEWRPFNPNERIFLFTMPNPLYPIVEAERAAQRAEYLRIIKETFVLMGSYRYLTFPYKGGYEWYIKHDGQTEFTQLTVDKNFWLATANGGYAGFLRPLKPADTNYDLQWNGFMARSILNKDLERKVKILCGF